MTFWIQSIHCDYYLEKQGKTTAKILKSVTKEEVELKGRRRRTIWQCQTIKYIQQSLDAANLKKKNLLFYKDNPYIAQDKAKIHRKIQKKYWQGKQIQLKMTDYMK